MDEIKLISIFICFCFLSIFGVQYINIKYFDNVPVVCYVDKKEVYRGTSAGISVSSSGANTTVQINGGFMYFFPKKYYVSNKVILEGAKQ